MLTLQVDGVIHSKFTRAYREEEAEDNIGCDMLKRIKNNQNRTARRSQRH